MQNINPWPPPEVEDSEELELIGDVVRTADFIAGQIERKELAETGRFHLEQSFGTVRVVEGDHVKAQAVSQGLAGPHDLLSEIIPPE